MCCYGMALRCTSCTRGVCWCDGAWLASIRVGCWSCQAYVDQCLGVLLRCGELGHHRLRIQRRSRPFCSQSHGIAAHWGTSHSVVQFLACKAHRGPVLAAYRGHRQGGVRVLRVSHAAAVVVVRFTRWWCCSLLVSSLCLALGSALCVADSASRRRCGWHRELAAVGRRVPRRRCVSRFSQRGEPHPIVGVVWNHSTWLTEPCRCLPWSG